MTSEQRSRLFVVFGVWTAVAVFFVTQGYLFHTDIQGEKPFPWGDWFFRQLTYCWLYALFTVPILRFVERWPLERDTWRRGLLVHVPTSFAVSMFVRAVHGGILLAVGTDPAVVGNNPLLTASLPGQPFSVLKLVKFTYYTLDVGALFYWVILLVGQAQRYLRQYRQAEVRAARLESQLAQAQLQALKMQLHPHFLFNTLNSIAELLHEDPDTAEKMVVRLGDFLRMTLHNSGEQTVALNRELEFLTCYLDIERIRFQDRLKIETDIDPETLAASVPNLILQPLAENAIRHGITRRSASGAITIRTERRNGTLRVQVEDDGPGLTDESFERLFTKGVGLSNTKTRLEQLYGSQHRLEVGNRPSGGLSITMEIPFSVVGR